MYIFIYIYIYDVVFNGFNILELIKESFTEAITGKFYPVVRRLMLYITYPLACIPRGRSAIPHKLTPRAKSMIIDDKRED